MNRTVAIVLIGITGLLAFGCKKGGAATTLRLVPVDVPNGYVRFDDLSNQGLTIAAPAGWRYGTKDTVDAIPALGGDEASMEKANEEQGKADVKASESQGLYIGLIERSMPIPGEERTRIELKRYDAGGPAQMEDVVAKMKDNMKNEDAPEPTDLPIGKATRIRSYRKLKDGGEVTDIEYGVVNGNYMYILKFITEQTGYDLDSLSKGVSQTLRIAK